jgi:hypothetical protein
MAVMILAAARPGLAADDVCAPLREFATSVTAGEKRTLRFHTILGGNFKDRDQPVSGAKRCDFEGYEPARAVCESLMKFGDLAFPGENAKRAIACLSPKNRFHFNTRLYAISVGFPYEMPNGLGRIDIDLHKNDELGGMTLTITANGFQPP